MASLNFKPQFAGAVEVGIKKQTIRRKRLQPVVLEDPLYLFTGLYTKKWRKLRTTHCCAVVDIFISSNKSVILNNRVLTDGEKCELAVNDGFVDFDAFFRFFSANGGLPVDGQLIEWL